MLSYELICKLRPVDRSTVCNALELGMGSCSAQRLTHCTLGAAPQPL
jgi:hypothetical protein